MPKLLSTRTRNADLGNPRIINGEVGLGGQKIKKGYPEAGTCVVHLEKIGFSAVHRDHIVVEAVK